MIVLALATILRRSKDSVSTYITQCARCGGSHDGLIFTPLVNATDEWSWWALCPATQQPVLMKEPD